MVKQAVILCGGRGERLSDGFRYQPVGTVPKPLVEVGGKPFVTYAIKMLLGIGIEDIILSVGYLKEEFGFLKQRGVRLVDAKETPHQSVQTIPDLQSLFILLNGDCFPIMDWRGFCNTDFPRVAVKIVDRDAGIAVVSKESIYCGGVDCGSISGMLDQMENYTILGGLHVGTYQGLERARQFMDLVVFGQ